MTLWLGGIGLLSILAQVVLLVVALTMLLTPDG